MLTTKSNMTDNEGRSLARTIRFDRCARSGTWDLARRLVCQPRVLACCECRDKSRPVNAVKSG